MAAARAVQSARYADRGSAPRVRTNGAADGELLMAVAEPDGGGAKLLTEAVDAMRLSARGYHRVLRVARTLADLDGSAGRRPYPRRRGAVLPAH